MDVGHLASNLAKNQRTSPRESKATKATSDLILSQPRFNFKVLMVAANGQHDDQEKHLASSACPKDETQSHGN